MKQSCGSRIFFAPFHASTDDASGSPCGAAVNSFRKAIELQRWPYDTGDDPSFYASRKFGGRLSWGICRQDVRNQLSPNDIVVFFSFRKFKDTGDSEYRLCAVATVKRSVPQTDLWQDRSLNAFTKYFNLLIRPSKSKRGAWEHFEPTLEGSALHRDWLWRIADHQGFQKKDFKRLQETDRLEAGAVIKGRSVTIARNYVLFSSDPTKTRVLPKPPIVAWHSKGRVAEEWNQDKFSQAVKRMTLGMAERASGKKRGLRIRNSQRAHRHIVFELPPVEALQWRAKLLRLIEQR